MVAPRIQTVKLAIEHAQNRRQRMPVRSVHMSERPQYSLRRETRGDVRVLVDVVVIIIADEFVMNRLAECQPRTAITIPRQIVQVIV